VRALALDVGEKRIGLAVGDTDMVLAMPAGVIHRRGSPQDFQDVLVEAVSRQADVLVVGMPLSLDGSVGPQARVVLDFVATLGKFTEVPIETWDERFSSMEADRRLMATRKGGRARGRTPAKGVQDAVAASVMLQAYLDAKHTKAPPSSGLSVNEVEPGAR
jgi:putative Holliday junction resolvase